MYELIKAGEKTYYINCPAKIGVYVAESNDVYLIDSGNDKDAAKKILKIIDENSWNLAGIINTHSNADHVGGNDFLAQKTDCKIISTGLENAFIRYPVLEPSFLYGGYPCKELRNKFLMATASEPSGNADDLLPQGLEPIRLGGHFFDMIGIKTSDDVFFVADSLFGENIIDKYHISFIYDVREFLNTLDMLETLNGRLFIPAHAEAAENLKPLIKTNRDKVKEIIAQILAYCAQPVCFEELLKKLFDRYGLAMDFNQYALVGSTLRSYLSYLHDEGKLTADFRDNRLLWTAAQ